MERDEAMRRERKGLEGDKLRERWKNKKKQGLGGWGGGGCYAHVQLQLYRLKAGCKIFPPLFPSTPPPPPPTPHPGKECNSSFTSAEGSEGRDQNSLPPLPPPSLSRLCG